DQCGLVDARLAQLQAGQQQRVLQPLHQLGGEHGVACFAGLAPGVQHAGQLAGLDFGVLQGALKQALGAFQQTEQQVLDENLAAAADYAAFGGGFQVPLGGGIQSLDELLQIDIEHSSILNEEGGAAQGDEGVGLCMAQPTGPAEAALTVSGEPQLPVRVVVAVQFQGDVIVQRVAQDETHQRTERLIGAAGRQEIVEALPGQLMDVNAEFAAAITHVLAEHQVFAQLAVAQAQAVELVGQDVHTP